MTDDIVARLRMRPTILRKNQFGDMETDRAATELFNGCHSIMRDAADTIDRLRAELCTAWEQAERWRDERDEARRDLCDLYVQGQPTASTMTEKDYAAELGWDCFKEDERC